MSEIKDQFAVLYGDGASIRINAIVIDDDDLVGRVNMRYLGKLRDETGIRHVDYHDPAAVMEILTSWETVRNALALILSDYDMPGLNGIDIAKRLREEFNDRLTVFILTSANIDEGFFKKVAEAADAGYVDAFIGKPFSVDQLRTAISEAITKRIEILKSGQRGAGQNF